MTDDLIDRIFEIQRKIDKFVFPRYGGMDQGMFTAKDQQSQTVFGEIMPAGMMKTIFINSPFLVMGIIKENFLLIAPMKFWPF